MEGGGLHLVGAGPGCTARHLLHNPECEQDLNFDLSALCTVARVTRKTKGAQDTREMRSQTQDRRLVNGAGFAIQIWKNVIITDIMSTKFYTIPAPSFGARLNNYMSFLEIMHLSESQIHRKTSLLPCNYSFNSQLMHRYCQLRSISSAPLVTSPYHGQAYSL